MWYSACLLFESVHSVKSDSEPLWEERIILIKASSETEAMGIAQKIGKDEEIEYPVNPTMNNGEQDKVKCIFRRIERVCEIDNDTLANGTEIFSRILRDSEVKSILTPFLNK